MTRAEIANLPPLARVEVRSEGPWEPGILIDPARCVVHWRRQDWTMPPRDVRLPRACECGGWCVGCEFREARQRHAGRRAA